jgi:hypothetical protein
MSRTRDTGSKPQSAHSAAAFTDRSSSDVRSATNPLASVVRSSVSSWMAMSSPSAANWASNSIHTSG